MGETTATYAVKGMTCDHCAAAVRQEIGALDAVTDVTVNLGDGRVTVTSDVPLADFAVADAVDEAGYELAHGRDD